MLNENPNADGAAIAGGLAAKRRPTILGDLRSGEHGEIPLFLSIRTASAQWTPAGQRLHTPPLDDKLTSWNDWFESEGLFVSLPANDQQLLKLDQLLKLGKFAAFWNAWFEHDNSVVDRLEVGKDYRFVLDVSRFQRKVGASVPVSDSFAKILKSEKRKVNFTVRVLFTGDPIRLANGQSNALARRLEVAVQRLYQADLSSDELTEWQAGRDTNDYLAKGSAGNIAFDVVAAREGCGAVTVSIWDGEGLRPLDHVTYEYAVGDASKCPGHGRLLSGFDLALSISSLLEGGKAEKADAAFHIFELPQSVHDQGSVVWFVDRTELEAAQKSGTDGGVYAWQTQSSLKQYVETPTQLPASIQAAREAASGADERPYERVAEELRKKLFSVDNEKRFGDTARKAQAALSKLVNESVRRPPVVLVRFAVSADTLDYLPLGLLTARAEKPVFQRPFVTVQPLQRERFYQGKACVDSWTLGLPTDLGNLSENVELDADVKGELTNFPLESPGWPPHFFARSIKDLRSRFKQAQQSGAAKPAGNRSGDFRGEGIVLLAHHADGDLWFDQRKDKLTSEDFKREFSRGSVAIVSACSVGGSGPLAYKLIERLNSKNVDAMIVSPFPVLTDFGTLLVLNFVREIDKARRADQTPTIAELYSAAWLRTAEYILQKFNRHWHDMGLEFVILGDPSIRLCAN